MNAPHATSAAGIQDDHDEFDLDGDTLREECGVFGILGDQDDAAALTALGFMRYNTVAKKPLASSLLMANNFAPNGIWAL